MIEQELIEKAREVLKLNDRQYWTVPAPNLYPHQWLWDSCFIAIGLRHVDIERAKTEITSLLRGQWSNGMVPNIIFDGDHKYHRDREVWRSYLSPYAPQNIATSGLTQPPMIAEAVVKIGQKLKLPERRTWYKQIFPHLVRFHEWLYKERDPHGGGLVVLVHPYESGLDNSPTWISELRKHSMPWWVDAIERLHLDSVVNIVRRDTKHIPPGQRMTNIEAMAYWAALARLRRKAYNSEAILNRPLFAVEDLVFNSVLIRANAHLKKIAETIGQGLPENLIASMELAKNALEQLWEEDSKQYFSRSFISHKLIEEPSIATFLALYSGAISPERAQSLVGLLTQKHHFATEWPVPTVPVNSPYFDPYKYWQGPTWINTNWLIIEGLKNYGFDKEAKDLTERTLALVEKSGMNEYFSPLDGSSAGAPSFSWTAALAIDLIRQ